MSQKSRVLINPYDSHVHWEATGSQLNDLNLATLKSAEDILTMPIKDSYRRGDWVVGYGWDESKWKDQKIPTRQILDRWISDRPVLLERADRHAAVLNTTALKLVGLTDAHAGFVADSVMNKVKKLIPKKSYAQVKANLLLGCQIFNRSGYTHIRDLTCNETQFSASLEIIKEEKLTLAIEQFFDCYTLDVLDSTIDLAVQAKKEAPHLIRVKGIKIFYDGALGSEGALLSRPYYGCGSNHGVRLYDPRDLTHMLERIWSSGLEAAVHAIGDQAAHEVVESARRALLKVGSGRLHIEHAEMLRPETIDLMKNMDVVCHMQPCHWLTDKAWTDKKLGALAQYLFRWRDLEKQNIKFDFGSDSPIEASSIFENLRAIEDAAQSGIPKTEKEGSCYMQHPDLEWVSGCSCEIQDASILKTIFQNRKIYQS